MMDRPGTMRRWLQWLWLAAVVRMARDRGLLITGWASAAYLGVAGWHFAEHAAGSDPEIVHVLLAVAGAAVLAGIVDVTVRTLRQRTGTAAEVEA